MEGKKRHHLVALIQQQVHHLLNILLTCLNPLSNSVIEAAPCIEVCTIDLARDLELPGLPTRKSGIRNSMQIAIMKTFSRRAAFLAMFGPRIMLFRSTSWQLKVMKRSVKTGCPTCTELNSERVVTIGLHS